MSIPTPLSELIKFEDLPEELSFLETVSSEFLDNIMFDHYEVGYSNNNKEVSHILHIITEEEFGLTIPGSGFRLLINHESIAS